MIKAGDIRQLLIDGREMQTSGEGAVEITLHGFNNEVTATAGGKMKTKKTTKLAGFSGLPILIDHSKGDLQFLQEKANSFDPFRVVVTLADGVQYIGSQCMINEELNVSSDEAECEVSIMAEIIDKI